MFGQRLILKGPGDTFTWSRMYHMASLIENTNFKATYNVISYTLSSKHTKRLFLPYFSTSDSLQSQILLNPPSSDLVSNEQAFQDDPPGTCPVTMFGNVGLAASCSDI